MSKAIRGLASTKLLPVWILVAAGVILILALPGVPPALATQTDADQDGVPESLELALGLDDQLADYDQDGLTDYEELFEIGSSPHEPNTDNDGYTLDSTDPDPLSGGGVDGGSNVTNSYAENRDHETLVGTTPFEGIGVNVSSGEFVHRVVLGCGGSVLAGGGNIVLTYRSGVTADTNWGYNWFADVDDHVVEQVDDDVEVYLSGIKAVFDEVAGSYVSPAGWPFTLTYDGIEDEFVLTAIRGGMKKVFDGTTGRQIRREDRFGNEETYARDSGGVLTGITTAEGLSITVTQHGTGRIDTVTAPGSRQWKLEYNDGGDLARITNPRGYESQFFQIHGSSSSILDHDVVRILDEEGRVVVQNEYDEYDRLVKQKRGSDEFTIDYDAPNNQATVTDWDGNERLYTFGSPVATQIVVYSNRNVNTADAASWTFNFTYNSNYLRTKTVFPRGNSVKYTWDSNYCLTEKRMKQDDAQADNNTNDLVWTYTYGTTYFQLKNSTDPNGNTTVRTHDSNEQTTKITHPTISHPDPDVTIEEHFTYLSNGLLETHTDGEGNVTKYEYYTTSAPKNLLKKEIRDYGTGKLNLTTQFTYNTSRFRTAVTDPDGHVTTFELNPMGLVEKETAPSPLSYETEYDYDASGRVIVKRLQNKDKTNTVVTANPWWESDWIYDPLGRPSLFTEEITSSTSRTTGTSYTANGQVEITTLPEGNEVKNVHDERGNLYQRIRGYDGPDEATESYTYDGNGNMTVRVDGRGKSWTSTYDLFDRKTKDEMPEGEYTLYVHDKNGNLTEVKNYDDEDVLLAHTKHHYDEMNRRWKTERWLDEPAPTADRWLATTYEHDADSRVVKITNPLGNRTYFEYDGAGRKSAQEDELGNRVEYGFSGDCCTATEIEEIEVKPEGGTETFRTEIVVDALNRVTERRIVDRDNSSNKHVFKAKYTSLSVAVEQEDAEENKSYLEHDGLRRTIKREVDLGGGGEIDTWLEYDKNGNLVKRIDDNGNETIWTYDERDLLRSITYDDGNHRDFEYNDDDTITGWTDENGTEVVNGYSENGWLTSRDITPATGVLGPTDEDYAYDGLGRLVHAENDNSIVTIEYDSLSRKIEEIQGPNPLGTSGKTFVWTWNDDDSRASVIYPSGFELHYTVDDLGRWTKIENATGDDLVTMTFHGPGFRQKQAAYLNGTSENMVYDGFRRVTDLDHKDSLNTTIAGFDYSYDKMGNPIYEERTHDSGKGDVYKYDKSYRLTNALIRSNDPSGEIADTDWLDYAYEKKIDYNMDDVSNRTSVVETPYGQGASTESYTSNSVNWYTVIDSVSQTHDDNGNLIDDGVRQYFYDYRNNLAKVEESSTVLAEYEFDAMNRRTKRVAGSTTTNFLTDGAHCVEEYDGSDALLRTFVYGQRIDEIRLMATADMADLDEDSNVSETVQLYYHRNVLGSITHVTMPGESVAEQYRYTPYGMPTIMDGQHQDLGETSAIGNPYMFTARRFDASTGLYHYRRREYDCESGRFLQRDPIPSPRNLYEYVESRPTIFVDPLGLLSYVHGGPGAWTEITGEAIRELAIAAADADFAKDLKRVDEKWDAFRLACTSINGQPHRQHRGIQVRYRQEWKYGADISMFGLGARTEDGVFRSGVVVSKMSLILEKQQQHRFVCIGPNSKVAENSVTLQKRLGLPSGGLHPWPSEDDEMAGPGDESVLQHARDKSVIMYEMARGKGRVDAYVVDFSSRPYDAEGNLLPAAPDLGEEFEEVQADPVLASDWIWGDWNDFREPRLLPIVPDKQWWPPFEAGTKGRGPGAIGR